MAKPDKEKDISHRLRFADPIGAVATHKLMDEGADEIDRLRKQVKKTDEINERDYSELMDKNHNLREALEYLNKKGGQGNHVHEYIRKVLAGEKPGKED